MGRKEGAIYLYSSLPTDTTDRGRELPKKKSISRCSLYGNYDTLAGYLKTKIITPTLHLRCRQTPTLALDQCV